MSNGEGTVARTRNPIKVAASNAANASIKAKAARDAVDKLKGKLDVLVNASAHADKEAQEAQAEYDRLRS